MECIDNKLDIFNKTTNMKNKNQKDDRQGMNELITSTFGEKPYFGYDEVYDFFTNYPYFKNNEEFIETVQKMFISLRNEGSSYASINPDLLLCLMISPCGEYIRIFRDVTTDDDIQILFYENFIDFTTKVHDQICYYNHKLLMQLINQDEVLRNQFLIFPLENRIHSN